MRRWNREASDGDIADILPSGRLRFQYLEWEFLLPSSLSHVLCYSPLDPEGRLFSANQTPRSAALSPFNGDLIYGTASGRNEREGNSQEKTEANIEYEMMRGIRYISLNE